jgi:hypothetical protein
MLRAADMLLLARLIAALVAPEDDALDAGAVVSPSPPSARRLVDGCASQCAAENSGAATLHGSTLEIDRSHGSLGDVFGSSDGARCLTPRIVPMTVTYCGMTVGTAGLTVFVFDHRTGRTHPVRATLSRRGVRVTVRF